MKSGIFESMQLKSTEELVAIWVANDHSQWRDEAFEVIKEILQQRLDTLPEQNQPVDSSLQSGNAKKGFFVSLKGLFRKPWAIVFIIVAILVVVASVIINISNERKIEVIRDEQVKVHLISSSDTDSLTYDNDLVKVTIGCDQFLSYLDATLNDPSYSQEDPENYRKMKNDIVATNSCADKGIKLNDYLVADLIERGTATVYDKRHKANVTTVRIWYYESICGLLCGRGTRSFYLSGSFFFPKGMLFLQVIDWMS